MWWIWLACQEAPSELSFTRPTPPGDVVGWIEVEHALDRGDAPEFEVYAGFLHEPWAGLQWAEPLQGLGDCGVLQGDSFPDKPADALSAGTLFFDSGLELPWALPPLAGLYSRGEFQGTWGAEMAVTAVGGEIGAFDWEPALRLPDEPLQLEVPAQDDEVIRGDLELRWPSQEGFVRAMVLGAGRDAVLCEEADDGHLIVPDALVDSDTETVIVYVSRVSLWWHELEPGRFVEIEVRATDRRSLRLEEP
jgi:hypothetical protein